MNNWLGHLPFARDLIEAVKPRLLVELGTHYGESYFGLCQSVLEAGIPCTCYAVDTWRGDAHAEFYGEAVFDDVAAHNQREYTGFSYLLRKTFDDALGSFSDSSIDLLHLDGFHTYEEASRDLCNWFPKLRPGGVMLLHDTAVRDWGFGVWRLWEEVSSKYPSFTFEHNWGLGVLIKPGMTPPPFLAELICASPDQQATARRYYAECGERLRDAVQAERSRIELLYPSVRGQMRHIIGVPNGCFETVRARLEPADDGRIRIECGRRAALIEISKLTVDTSGGHGWSMGPGDTGKVTLEGNAVVFPGSSPLNLLVLGPDAQVILPRLDLQAGSVLQLTLRAQPIPDSLIEEARGWAAVCRRLAQTAEGSSFLQECRAGNSAEDPFHQMAELRSQLSACLQQIDSGRAGSAAERQRFETELRAVRASWSWRITSPLRRLGGWLLRATQD